MTSATISLEEIRKADQKVERAKKTELDRWAKKIKLLHPIKGDLLVIPAEAHFDFALLSEALKQTPIVYAIVVPGGKASLLSKADAIKLLKKITKK